MGAEFVSCSTCLPLAETQASRFSPSRMGFLQSATGLLLRLGGMDGVPGRSFFL